MSSKLCMYLFKIMKIFSEYIRGHVKSITMQQLGFIMRGVAMVYHMQLLLLESMTLNLNMTLEDSKNLLSLLNGDHLWNNYLKKQMKKDKKYNGGGKSVPKGVNKGLQQRKLDHLALNILDVKQILNYTKDRLDFLSSQHSDLALDNQV